MSIGIIYPTILVKISILLLIDSIFCDFDMIIFSILVKNFKKIRKRPSMIILRIIFYSVMIRSTCMISNPFRLEDMAIASVRNSIENRRIVDILEKIYPNIFTTEESLTASGFMNVICNKKIPISRIDLSNLKIERIPESIVDRISNLEILDLSGNPSIKLNEEWFNKIIKRNNILELSLNNCNLTETDLDVIYKIKTLQKLNISQNVNLNVKKDGFRRILKRLKHLNISNCDLDFEDLQFIFENAENLNSLDYSCNSLDHPFRYLSITNENLKNSLESLKLSFCSLTASDLEHIFVFENLREIDLSGNFFSVIDSRLIKRMFVNKVAKKFNSTVNKFLDYGYSFLNNKLLRNYGSERSDYQDIFLDNLRKVNLENCKIDSPEFIENLFNLEKLEYLNISKNILSLDFRNSHEYKSKNSLKALNMSKCKRFDENVFMRLSEFKYLEYLDISECEFDGLSESFTLGSLANSLIHLNVSCNSWNLNGLKAITECTKLNYLDASFNDFRNVPTELNLKELKNTLRETHLSSCGLNLKFLEKLTLCKEIKKLSLSKNLFSDISTKFSFKNLTRSLISLNIDNCFLDLNGLKAITKCTKLAYLSAWRNRFSDIESGFDLGNLKYSLKEANFGFSKLNEHGLHALTKCVKLKKLNVSNCHFIDLPDKISLDSLKNSLEELIIDNCCLQESHFKSITDCTRLKYLDAKCNNFGNLPVNFELGVSKNSLECLILNNCGLKSESIKAITDCKKLERLLISQNNFGKITPDIEFGCSKESLIELWANSSNMDHFGLSLITDCPKLQKLYALDNNFKRIPNFFRFGRSIYSLKDLDLSWSKLNANGLEAVFECSKLENLVAKGCEFENVSNNLTIGIIKYSLRFVDLSESKLPCKILNLLNECTELKRLTLSRCTIFDQNRLKNFLERVTKTIFDEISEDSD